MSGARHPLAYDLELVSADTGDGLSLDGARYWPRSGNRRAGRAFLLVHGMRWSFHRGPSRWLGPLIAARGYDCLALNLRDHDSSEPRPLGDAHHDLRAGIDLLAADADEVVPFAHGYGCTKVMSYRAGSHDDRVTRHVLATLGAVRRNAPSRWAEALDNARAMHGRTLVVQGAADTLIDARDCAGELAAVAPGTEVDLVMLDGANHYFDDRHDALVDTVTAWETRGRQPGAAP